MPKLKAVVIELKKDAGVHRAGERFELPNVRVADKLYGENGYTIEHYADGTPYDPADDAPTPQGDKGAKATKDD